MSLCSTRSKPAVILLNAYAYLWGGPSTRGQYYTGSDREFSEFSTYYRLPVLSVKAAMFRLMQQGMMQFTRSFFSSYFFFRFSCPVLSALDWFTYD